jgi:hypothetical protein
MKHPLSKNVDTILNWFFVNKKLKVANVMFPLYFYGASTLLEMFELNISLINVQDKGYDASHVFEVESSSHRHEVDARSVDNLGLTNLVSSTTLYEEAPR